MKYPGAKFTLRLVIGEVNKLELLKVNLGFAVLIVIVSDIAILQEVVKSEDVF